MGKPNSFSHDCAESYQSPPGDTNPNNMTSKAKIIGESTSARAMNAMILSGHFERDRLEDWE